MKTLIYGAGPIGQWLALRLHRAGRDVALLARGETLTKLRTVSIGLQLNAIGTELAEMVDEFSELRAEAGIDTPNLDDLLGQITQEANLPCRTQSH